MGCALHETVHSSGNRKLPGIRMQKQPSDVATAHPSAQQRTGQERWRSKPGLWPRESHGNPATPFLQPSFRFREGECPTLQWKAGALVGNGFENAVNPGASREKEELQAGATGCSCGGLGPGHSIGLCLLVCSPADGPLSGVTPHRGPMTPVESPVSLILGKGLLREEIPLEISAASLPSVSRPLGRVPGHVDLLSDKGHVHGTAVRASKHLTATELHPILRKPRGTKKSQGQEPATIQVPSCPDP